MLFFERLQEDITAEKASLPFGRGGSDEILIHYAQDACTCCSQYVTDKQKMDVQT
jgi:hypothetical protein